MSLQEKVDRHLDYEDWVLTENELGLKAGFNSGWPIRNFRLTGGLPYIQVNKRIYYRWSTYLKWLSDKEAASVKRDTEPEYGRIRAVK
jgi:hypothetical protein